MQHNVRDFVCELTFFSLKLVMLGDDKNRSLSHKVSAKQMFVVFLYSSETVH